MATLDTSFQTEARATAGGIDWEYIYTGDVADKFFSNYARCEWQAFKQHLPRNGKVLEIGCGTSRLLLQAVKALGNEGYGIDIEPRAFRHARAYAEYLGADANYVQGDGLCLPFPDNTFDAVCSVGVVEHFV